MKKILQTVLQTVAGILFFVVIVVAYNVISPVVTMSRLYEGYWGGYYDTQLLGRIGCLARFYRSNSGDHLVMVLMSPGRTTDVMDVKRNSSGETFVYLTMTARRGGMKVEAKQLYLGRRYMVERLLVGRFKDFWGKNTDDAIHGEWTSEPTRPDIVIERVADDRVLDFCKKYVLKEDNFASVAELEAFLDGKIPPSPP